MYFSSFFAVILYTAMPNRFYLQFEDFTVDLQKKFLHDVLLLNQNKNDLFLYFNEMLDFSILPTRLLSILNESNASISITPGRCCIL
jgi:hypothetical protein